MWLVLLALLLHPFALADSGKPAVFYPLEAASPLVNPSYYTGRLTRILDRWPPPTVDEGVGDPRKIVVLGIHTPGKPELIGMIKHFELAFPLEKVREQNERFEDYPKIWADVEHVAVGGRDGNRIMTEWVRAAPAFFLPKLRYRMLYTVDARSADRVAYRQQYVDGNGMSSSEALIVLDRLSPQRTRVSVLDFFEPDAGPFRAIVAGQIWRRALENSFRDDVAFRARLEHPDWSTAALAEEADRALARAPMDTLPFTDKIRFP